MVTSDAATQNDSLLIQIWAGHLGRRAGCCRRRVDRERSGALPRPQSSCICRSIRRSAGACRIVDGALRPIEVTLRVSRRDTGSSKGDHVRTRLGASGQEKRSPNVWIWAGCGGLVRPLPGGVRTDGTTFEPRRSLNGGAAPPLGLHGAGSPRYQGIRAGRGLTFGPGTLGLGRVPYHAESVQGREGRP